MMVSRGWLRLSLLKEMLNVELEMIILK